MHRIRIIKYFLFLLVLLLALACRQSNQLLVVPTIVYNKPFDSSTPTALAEPTNSSFIPMVRQPEDPTIVTPTPDAQRDLPEIRYDTEKYTVQKGDTLGIIATKYKINVPMILMANQFANPDLLEVGQEIIIPAPIPGETGSILKSFPTPSYYSDLWRKALTWQGL